MEQVDDERTPGTVVRYGDRVVFEKERRDRGGLIRHDYCIYGSNIIN